MDLAPTPSFLEGHSPPVPMLATLGAIYGALAVGTVVAGVARARKGDAAKELWQRCVSWWWMITAAAAALLIGPIGVLILFAFVSYLALQEFLSIIPSRKEDRLIILLAYLVIPANALLVWANLYGIFLIFIPVYVFVIFPFLLVMAGQVKRFLNFTGALHWGTVLTVYNISYVPYLMILPKAGSPVGGAGLVLALLLLTELNDVAQYISGKLIGGPKIVPNVSPKKTWAGFVGGVVATTAVSAFLTPFLTPFDTGLSILVGFVIAVAGFAGDVAMSAIKRDLGLKDTSALIPGHGGILDRIDSLTFTAPLYFHILIFFCFAGYSGSGF
ncbi:MAG: phosphatidate cytidylyltransferase [Alphaproteobacteria bacterium]